MKCRSIAMCVILLATSALPLWADEPGEQPTSRAVSAGPVTVTSSTDKSTASVVEAIHLKLSAQAPRGTRIEWPPIEKKLGDWEVTHVAKLNDVPSTSDPNLREWVLQLTLESIKTGELEVPPIDLHYATDAKSDFQSIQTSPLRIRVASVLEDRADPTRFRDIKQTVDVPIPAESSKAWMVWAGSATAALALILVVAAAKRYKRGLAPAKWALARIADLEHQEYAGSDTTSMFNEVVAIVRRYVELEFGVAALSRTTNEFLTDALQEIDLPSRTSDRIKWLVSVGDEIKFARLGIGKQHYEQAISQAKALISECDEHRRVLEKGAS